MGIFQQFFLNSVSFSSKSLSLWVILGTPQHTCAIKIHTLEIFLQKVEHDTKGNLYLKKSMRDHPQKSYTLHVSMYFKFENRLQYHL